MGRMIPEYERPELREIIHGSYRLIYELQSNRIDMLTIWHQGSNHLINRNS